jgi:hypothetical protein
MSGARRVRALAVRSIWDVYERVWADVRLWLVVTILVALLSAWRDLPWVSYTVITVLALACVLLGVFLWDFGGNLRHPDQSRDWIAEEPRPLGEGADRPIRFSIRSKIGSPYLESHACEVGHPNGRTYRALSTDAGSGFCFFFWYPQDFAEAATPATGSYEIVWFLPGKSGKLREVVRVSTEITV